MSRNRFPFIGTLFQQQAQTPAPLDITSFTESIAELPPPMSEESESILRRGNWDYMWRRVRDLAAQEHPEFTADPEYPDESQAR